MPTIAAPNAAPNAAPPPWSSFAALPPEAVSKVPNTTVVLVSRAGLDFVVVDLVDYLLLVARAAALERRPRRRGGAAATCRAAPTVAAG